MALSVKQVNMAVIKINAIQGTGEATVDYTLSTTDSPKLDTDLNTHITLTTKQKDDIIAIIGDLKTLAETEEGIGA